MRSELGKIYWQHRQGLYTLALAITRCPERARDAVQDAFLRLWRTRAVPRGDPVPYVFTAVRRAAIDQVRRRPPDRGPPASIFRSDAADPAMVAIEAEREYLLRRAIDGLPDEQREALVLRVYAGLTFEQMAGVLGQPLSTVSWRYRRALEGLGERMGPRV